jgi:O-antigen/teichoic acid export membrane protein
MRTAASAGLWSTLDAVGRQGVQLVVTMILARLLAPADFGLVALMAFFTNVSLILVQAGLTTALIRHGETGPAEESSVFWLNIAGSALLSALLIAAAPPLARFYGQPLLAPLIWVAAAQVMLCSLVAVQTALLSRELRFASLAKLGIFSTALGGAAGVAAALAGAGVWALALQTTAIAALNCLGIWFVSAWRPRLHFNFREIRHLFGFGAWVAMSSVADVVYTQGVALVIGKLYGVRELGFYNRASSTQLLPMGVLAAIIARIALPLFSAKATDTDGLRRGLKLSIEIGLFVGVPVMAGIALLPDLVIRVLFGDRWMPAAPVLCVLAGAGAFYPLHLLNVQAALALGEAAAVFRIQMVKSILGIAFVAGGSLFGIMGLALAQLALSIVALFLNAEPVRRRLGYGVVRQLRDSAGIWLMTAAMAAAVLVLKPQVDLPPVAALALLAAVGAATYLGTGFLLRLRSFREALGVGRLLLSTASPSSSA